MSIDRTEATRLSRICLPKILQQQLEERSGYNNDGMTLTEDNVTIKSLCRLWAGMGYIYQVTIKVPSVSSSKQQHQFIIKRVIPPPKKSRSVGDERKATSYLIEANFYEKLAPTLINDEHADLAIPVPYHVERDEDTDQVTICMSRLVGSPGYLGDGDRIHAVLTWLATLHAATWGSVTVDEYVRQKIVQPIGSYWHLDTRPDEHGSMPRRGWEGRLKRAARAIDERLKRDEMQCCIHGDAKDANMLFNDSHAGVSMYDFQYCGKAPPSVDLAYFLCVAVGDTDIDHIKYYHQQLLQRLNENERDHIPTLKELEDSVSLALCDFQRFLSGWGQWGSDISSVVIQVLDRLDGGDRKSVV